MNRNGPSPSARRAANAATVVVSMENNLPKAAEVLCVLPLQRVARSAEVSGDDLVSTATTVQCALAEGRHIRDAWVSGWSRLFRSDSFSCWLSL